MLKNRKKMQSSIWILFLTGFITASFSEVPESISIQGTLQDQGGDPLTGIRDWQLNFFDAATLGSQIGSDVTGTLTLSEGGRFNIELIPPSAILSASDVWYELAIDSDLIPDGIDEDDYFPSRVRILSVPFALKASESDTLDGLDYSDFAPAGHVHDDSYWKLGGNTGTTAGTHYIGTTDNVALELQVNSSCVLRLEPTSGSPNVISGDNGNAVDPSVVGGTIGGGGSSVATNTVSGDYGTVGGGRGNVASGRDSVIAGGPKQCCRRESLFHWRRRYEFRYR